MGSRGRKGRASSSPPGVVGKIRGLSGRAGPCGVDCMEGRAGLGR